MVCSYSAWCLFICNTGAQCCCLKELLQWQQWRNTSFRNLKNTQFEITILSSAWGKNQFKRLKCKEYRWMGCDFLLGIYSIYQKAYIFITNFTILACCNTGKTVKSMQIYAVEGIAHVGAGAELFINVSFVTTFDSA